MGPLVTFIIVLMVLLSFGAYTHLYRKDFLGTWKGQRLQIVYRYSHMDILLDDQAVMHNIKHEHTQNLHCTFPLLGQKKLQLLLKRDSSGEVASIEVLIDDETVTLNQMPLNFWGNTDPSNRSKNRMIEDQQQTMPLDDSRLQSARNLYQSIKSELDEDEDGETAALLQRMMTELVNHLEIGRRIEESQSDYQALGSSQVEIESTKNQNEQRIQMLLNGLKDIHLTVIQRTVISRENLSGDIQRILSKIEAQIEVDKGT